MNLNSNMTTNSADSIPMVTMIAWNYISAISDYYY